MNPKPMLRPPLKAERNSHELSADESRPAESREHLTQGGGHRSGSRGVGTSATPGGKPKPRHGPSAAAVFL